VSGQILKAKLVRESFLRSSRDISYNWVHDGIGQPYMSAMQPIFLIIAMFVVVLGLPIGLYLVLTRNQRRTTREIKAAAIESGWQYRKRRWQGNPTAFRIDGRVGGLTWKLTSRTTSGYDRSWTVVLALVVPQLASESDLAIQPREQAVPGYTSRGGIAMPGLEAKLGAVSRVLASDARLYRDGRELTTGISDFDAAYKIQVLPEGIHQAPVDAGFARRWLHWPPAAIAPHSLMAWRDPLGLHLQARLPGPPNWATVSYFLELAAELANRLPASPLPTTPRTPADRIAARLS
jgi:hypothetical protein